MSINFYNDTFLIHSDYSPFDNKVDASYEKNQVIKNIAKSLEESSLEFLAHQLQERKIQNIKQSLKRSAEEFEMQVITKRPKLAYECQLKSNALPIQLNCFSI